jgi:hypothetical protein
MKLNNPASFLVTRMDALITAVNAIIVESRGHNPHKLDDPNVEANVDSYDLASNQTLINALKAKYNTHRVSATYHLAADATNTLATADQSDQATGNALANAAKTAISAHIILLTSHYDKDNSMIVDALALPANATDLPTLIVLTNALKAAFNKHVVRSHIPAVGAIPTLDVAP